MSHVCHFCQKELKITDRVSRSESCPACNSDLHCCMNCAHYDPKVYNECQETQAERVLEKDRSNFCGYFSFREEERSENKIDEKELAKKKLEELFKK